MSSWDRALLRSLGVKPTAQNLRLLRTWQRWEGGHTKNKARFNWLNTTRGSQYPGINSVGVRAFPDFQTGIRQTTDTIQSGYPNLVKALQSGDPYSYQDQSALMGDFSKWVSGSTDGNLGYARKVLESQGPAPAPAKPPGKQLGTAPPGLDDDLDPLEIAFADDPEFLELLRSIGGEVQFEDASPPKGKTKVSSTKGGILTLPTKWKPTHVTDGLDWGSKSAVDIMGAAGTAVGAPEDGTVVYFHPTGAQGGGSMLFRAKSGRTYWIGHIDGGLKKGSKVKRGQRIASISGDHPRPHVHLDAR